MQEGVGAKVPVELLARVTVPIGVLTVPGEVSITVTLHVDSWLTTTGLMQVTVVSVKRGVIASPIMAKGEYWVSKVQLTVLADCMVEAIS
jgi:hypothetical protein